MTRSTAFALVSLAVTLASPNAEALHPTSFPHQHVSREVKEEPQEANTELRSAPYSYLGIGLAGSGVIDHELGMGFGAEVFGGWRLNPWAALELELFINFHDRPTEAKLVNAISGMVRLHLSEQGLVEPYLLLGVSVSGVHGQESLMGFGFASGAGLDFNLNADVAIGLKALYRGAFLNAERGTESVDLTTSIISAISGSAHVRLNF